ncbi:bifunctional biotin--[acetyl-CoA-carboxylase] ligase/biotin operon repressor BirA [Aliiglaciecola sp. LCG003]|uniref:bifunctional biotin--[acetyl-CoA-carboxylase] ligase/biotin operon repressor BirA n=1 Tax=Aliiglaciecola sp. LCG003 TaxID=3053655 RepID=UPI002573407E|nr:bifunctional biotin--[acetyl-CoA-carboxylase] ligase/biotin operon repressor BirA [Aliiglaciecola sp. LCG003]WJG08839.1 bifunctional biotin--[acetyl-CoA-carboxylase] ligase/biotin operon repressor BirA [Aliiglaciecola sp. LCG003]
MNYQTNLSRTVLLQRLADGNFHSGETLGQELGVSRSAVSKHVKALTDLGLDIFSVTGKGYRLAKPLSLLKHSEIIANLTPNYSAQINVLNVIDSTNQYLKELSLKPSNGYVCLAEAQTAGRGRHGRTWVSPYGASIYMSMFWSFPGGYQAIGGLSLAVGIAVVNALTKLGVADCQLKWPNDIYLKGKKLAGILVEVEGQMGAACDCIIGIGLNIDLPEHQITIDQPWTDLAKATGGEFDRNFLAANIIDELTTSLRQFEQQGLLPVIAEWKKLDFFADQAVTLTIGNKKLTGICRGIDKDGALLLEHNGEVRPFHGGEISVRAG